MKIGGKTKKQQWPHDDDDDDGKGCGRGGSGIGLSDTGWLAVSAQCIIDFYAICILMIFLFFIFFAFSLFTSLILCKMLC